MVALEANNRGLSQETRFPKDCRWNVVAKSLSRRFGAAIVPEARFGNCGYVQISNLLY